MIAHPVLLTLLVSLGLSAVVVYLNERHHLLRGDLFPSAAAKGIAYGWLTLLIVLVSLLVVFASAQMQDFDPSQLSFWSLFNFHLVLVVFLLGWWVLSGAPPLRRFLNLPASDRRQALFIGVAVGVGGWAFTIFVALTIGMILVALDLLPRNLEPSPLVPWMAGLPAWQKLTLIVSAMTVEEAFFRGWLQKRVGLIVSTIVFALAHSGYGQPMMLVGITVISLIIGYTFYRTRNLLPCIIAHGVFDAIQLFVVVPLAMKVMSS